jgi:flagellar basal-body rod protein FlgB
MIIDSMFSRGPVPVLEQVLRFSSARQRLLQEDVANIDTPGFRQKDLSLSRFQQTLAGELASPGGVEQDNSAVTQTQEPASYIMFHDGNNRSAEQLMTDGVKNAMMHNMMIELLREQFSILETALKDHLS